MTKIPHNLRLHVVAVRRLAKAKGIRATARAAGLTPMSVSRFSHGAGADDIASFYMMARALGCRIELVTP